ncbi:MAG: hypothetical protein JJ913_11170 [Rhizobiaceae bacterium]|nr:hypothetical protein [Rhizobiaceae bacterium]
MAEKAGCVGVAIGRNRSRHRCKYAAQNTAAFFSWRHVDPSVAGANLCGGGPMINVADKELPPVACTSFLADLKAKPECRLR